MPWLWYVAPIAVVVLYLLTGLPGRHERRRDRELSRWFEVMRPEGDVEGDVEDGPRRVGRLPGPLAGVLEELGGGEQVAAYALHEKLAYVAAIGPDLQNGSEYQVVVAKLEEPAPTLRARPLPIVDGRPVPNTGLKFKKDPGFAGLYLVECDARSQKAVTKWMSRKVRDALRELPYAWLVVQGNTMALAIYGPADADRMYALVTAADVIFAEYGAEGGPSLFFDEEDGGEEDEEGEEDEGEEAKSAKEAREAKSAKADRKEPAKASARAG
ncbi:MAG TPA: hypothetical protein VLS89_17485 [Candidatus Nanopelagicales bacterium]|nr:hypothetical protein [Candidatus Nanopelagicales bacterium]